MDYLHGVGNAMAIKRDGIEEFNQLSGKEMLAYIRDREVYLVDVQGNAETVFYPREDDGTYIGVNRTQSSFVKLYIKDRQIDYVLFTTSTSGVMIPLDQALENERKLSGFFWAEEERPHSPQDIFSHPARTIRPVAGTTSAAAENDEEEEEQDNKSTRRQNR